MPTKTITRETYARRIERVFEFLLDHLDDDVDMHRLAEEAHLSAYHFHRVFHGMTGETVAETVRRLRLHRAAVKLISSATPIAALAIEAGYTSTAAFNRAFRAAYALPPAAYRAKQSRSELRRPFIHAGAPTMFEVKFIEVPHVRVIALPHRGDYMEIGSMFEKLNVWAAGKNLLGSDARWFGIYHDDPAAKPAAELRSEACLAIPSSFAGTDLPPGGFLRQTPAGRCAELLFKGPYSSLEQPYHWLFGTWLPQSNEEPRDEPCFEEYLNDARNVAPSECLTAIRLPLKG